MSEQSSEQPVEIDKKMPESDSVPMETTTTTTTTTTTEEQ